MNVSNLIRMSCLELQRKWTMIADSAFLNALPDIHDEMARGEFISAFISERGLNFPNLPAAPQRTVR